jgi:hypothetical protein
MSVVDLLRPNRRDRGRPCTAVFPSATATTPTSSNSLPHLTRPRSSAATAVSARHTITFSSGAAGNATIGSAWCAPAWVFCALAGTWDALRPLLVDVEQLAILRAMDVDLKPSLRAAIVPTNSRRALRCALLELNESIEHFNARWGRFLAAVDLSGVNRERENYNCYYLLEKECAIRSARLASRGFVRLEPVTHADLAARFSPLALVRLP